MLSGIFSVKSSNSSSSAPSAFAVLARLLKLNHERYAEEVKQGLHEKKKPRNTRKPRKKPEEGGGMFE
jgi:hypothetical protein